MKAPRPLMERGVEDGVFPGAVLLAAKDGQEVFFEAFGRARLEPERIMTTQTVFDLASLTKPLATAVALMLLVQTEKVDLDQTLGEIIEPLADTDKKSVTIRQLLSHSSGLPDYRPYYEELAKLPTPDRKSELRRRLLAEKLIQEPGEACLYSDIGFMILEWVVETTAGKSLDRFVSEAIYDPLKLKDLFFVPLASADRWPHQGGETLSDDGSVETRFAATEACPWRGKVLDGEVHDDNAYAAGGVAGHAGLFGTALDVCRLLQELLNVWGGDAGSGVFERRTVQTFFRRQRQGTWALGFDTPSRPESSSGKHFSDQSVGHLGFAGTSFWMDLQQRVIVILLTNRIHPKRDNEAIKAFRPLLHDAVMEVILD